jgi:hypothetical protein
MNTSNKVTRILGIAFLLQFVTSISSGTFLKQAWYVPGNINETLLKIAGNPVMMRANILVDMLTALGIIFLGVMLFLTLRKHGEIMALTALGFYVLEATLLAVSRTEAFALLRISEQFVTAGQPDYLLTMGNLAYEAMDFIGNTLHMLVFCAGAILFYTLLDRSRIVPRVLSLWGLITVSFLLIWTVLSILGQAVPFILYVPYAPFELVIGIWLLVKGAKGVAETE